ncbi:actin-domain-containing protein [Phaeosphaeriaceae sp. PMI808]|nr:actin-domain-containing protein [Phaeosphaeriaceae sp. PMI808]
MKITRWQTNSLKYNEMPPKGSKKSTITVPSSTLVLDNGAYTLKAGIVPSASVDLGYDNCRVIPNCIARSTRDKCTYIASELDLCKDFGELAFRRPVEKGFIVNWEAEKAIWEHEFMGEGMKVGCDPKETNLLLTEKPNCPKELQKNCDEVVFEQFEFAAYYRCVGPRLNAYHLSEHDSISALPQECLLVIDTSYSDTTILPLYNGRLIQSAVRRLTVGGKLLTNYLKELASLRHYNMMEETYLLNEIKEAVSYVAPSSQQFSEDLGRTWKGRLGNKRELDSSIVVDYVLPDYENAIHGHARPHDPAKSRMRRGLQPLQGPREDLLPMGNERFAVPELLFNPSDIGIQESGISGAVLESLGGLPEALKVSLLSNVIVVGGNSLIKGFIERLEAELRALIPSQYLLNISRADDPIKHTWLGAARFASQPELLKENFLLDVYLRIPTSMRRIPRPSRAIDASSPLFSSVQKRVSPSPCQSVVVPCTDLQTSIATFSTTPSKAFLVTGKQDKRKHQQFVRRWQKRLLGDSEPIGAHVDPYDPTSPVRIAPEEQGDYEEVLEEDKDDNEKYHNYRYLPAERGTNLMAIGGEKWIQQKLEVDVAKEFEKLTQRTYTPLSLHMADEIEDLTGTPYTLPNDNLRLAQQVQEVTGRPFTSHNFGLQVKINRPADIYRRFIQAVSEVYSLKEAGLDMDLANSPNRGIYEKPYWAKDIKLLRSDNGELVLAYPRRWTSKHFIKAMQEVPEWSSTPPVEEEVLLDEAADILESEEPVPTMDPTTPAFKRAAVVKVDSEKKAFDFMSNRPVPRVKPVEDKVAEEVVAADVSVAEPSVPTPSRMAEIMSAFEASNSATNRLRYSVLEHRAQRLADQVTALRAAARQSKSPPMVQKKASPAAAQGDELKWRHVPITDLAVKFALFKRLFQLTGIRISDPHLSSSNTLGQLYNHLCEAAKPRPTSLFSTIHIEGQKAREDIKKQQSTQVTSRRRADLGDLITLGNVEVRRVKASKTEKRTKTGMAKYDSRMVEGTRQVPDFGSPLSNKAATMLAKWTGKQQEAETEAKRAQKAAREAAS